MYLVVYQDYPDINDYFIVEKLQEAIDNLVGSANYYHALNYGFDSIEEFKSTLKFEIYQVDKPITGNLIDLQLWEQYRDARSADEAYTKKSIEKRDLEELQRLKEKYPDA